MKLSLQYLRFVHEALTWRRGIINGTAEGLMALAVLPIMVAVFVFELVFTAGYCLARKKFDPEWTWFKEPTKQPTAEDRYAEFCRRVDQMPLDREDREAMKNTARWKVAEDAMREFESR